MEQGAGKRIVVIGAGIVGASLAYHLAGKGADVTLIEAEDIACGATGRSLGWINATYAGPDPIAQLRGAAINEYRRLETELPALKIRWTGALSYGASIDDIAQASATLLPRAEILAREPNLKHPPQQARFAAEEGALEPAPATHALIAGAQSFGARLLTQTRVLGFTLSGTQVTGVETTTGIIASDIVVIAAGIGTPHLTALLNASLPIAAAPVILIRYKTQADVVRGIISNPQMEVRRSADNTLLAAEDYLDDTPQNSPQAIALRTAKAIQNELHGIMSIEPESACIGLKPVTADSLPIVGFLPNVTGVYVCSIHPGVTLAAIVGRLASEEIIDGQSSAALAPCRPARFL
ncbi:FAD-binding oxidoreductase [Pseudomonas sp. MPR-ANC1]|uniref:NAD(P)/FAD-dependent oxidoreductase n=1 Tax=Pseudomonas sp. MPR-ANC1 TaxID=2075548 RepID=UPI000CD0B925|nr:FAD-binding oxidoreductase [Pseudomonas sp. MPR-ANC1]POA42334.1 FAD-binding oxidoreductase [Pseudomonas sp. MPR-ANC1]